MNLIGTEIQQYTFNFEVDGDPDRNGILTIKVTTRNKRPSYPITTKVDVRLQFTEKGTLSNPLGKQELENQKQAILSSIGHTDTSLPLSMIIDFVEKCMEGISVPPPPDIPLEFIAPEGP